MTKSIRTMEFRGTGTGVLAFEYLKISEKTDKLREIYRNDDRETYLIISAAYALYLKYIINKLSKFTELKKIF